MKRKLCIWLLCLLLLTAALALPALAGDPTDEILD